MSKNFSRRNFLQAASAGTAGLSCLGTFGAPMVFSAPNSQPAIMGGDPIHTGGWPNWPEWRREWEPQILEILRSGNWYRGTQGKVQEFESAYADLLGAEKCVATASGTTALITSLYVMGVDAGDEVIVSPFTFIASYNVILMNKALPVMADTDPETWTMDPASIESRITDRTKAIMPVHIYGIPCEMDAINAIAEKHELAVVEDACQAWLAEYKGKKCGTLGDIAGFSFQNSKHIPSGEGGAVTSMNAELIDRASAYHNCGRSSGNYQGRGYFTRGTNFRMQHYQGSMLLQQFEKLKEETKIRQDNAAYLMEQMEEIPGITPAKLPENSKPAWHLFPFRYDANEFNGLSRSMFIRSLRAEGVPCGGGYREQYYDGLLDEAIESRGYKRLFGAERLKQYRDSFQDLKGNRETCENTVTMSQSMLLAPRTAMEQIIAAMKKIQANSAEIAKS
jgi:dTDP-4-amino-4,6-dideoxygalactose transaminase